MSSLQFHNSSFSCIMYEVMLASHVAISVIYVQQQWSTSTISYSKHFKRKSLNSFKWTCQTEDTGVCIINYLLNKACQHQRCHQLTHSSITHLTHKLQVFNDISDKLSTFTQLTKHFNDISDKLSTFTQLTKHSTYQEICMWRHRNVIVKQLIRIICERITFHNGLQTQQTT